MKTPMTVELDSKQYVDLMLALSSREAHLEGLLEWERERDETNEWSAKRELQRLVGLRMAFNAARYPALTELGVRL